MTVLFHVLLVLHLIGWAIVLGSALAGLRSATLYAGALHGILTALVTGVAMVALGLVRGSATNWPWVVVKLALALAVTALVWIGGRRPKRVTSGWLGAIAGLTALDVAVAVLWT